jgi:FixJ family two-component response regulator
MKTVQQFEHLGASQRGNAYPRPSSAADNIIANLPFQPDKLLPLNCARAAIRPAIERAMLTDEENVRVDHVNKYSKDCLEPNASVASMRPKEDVRRRHAAVDGRSVVYVVDGDISMRESLEAVIRLAGWRCELSASAQEFLSKPKILEHSCLLLDFNLPDLTGLDLQKKVRDHLSEMPIVFLTRYADVRIAVEAMKSGAIDFLTKPCDNDVLLAAIQKALERSGKMSDNARMTQAIRQRHATLSRREQEVITLVVTGLLNKQIGFELGISEITVKAHRGQVMRKMGAKSLAGLVTMAGQIGLAMAPICQA